MTFAGRPEIVFDSEVVLRSQRGTMRRRVPRGRRPANRSHAEHADEEVSGGLLLTSRHRQLHVVKPVEGHETILPEASRQSQVRVRERCGATSRSGIGSRDVCSADRLLMTVHCGYSAWT